MRYRTLLFAGKFVPERRVEMPDIPAGNRDRLMLWAIEVMVVDAVAIEILVIDMGDREVHLIARG